MSFVGLHIHSDYSLLDGASQLPQLIDRAVELGMPAIALTDHGVMYGAIQLIKLCRNKNIKPIIGNEMYVIKGDIEKQQKGKKFHQVVLAKNTQGYKNLVKLTTLSHLHGFQGKGIFARPCINRELLEKYHEGLIVTSGCLAGEVPQNIMQGKLEEAKKIAKWYKDLFGEDYYLEIQDHGFQEDRVVNTGIVKIAEKLKIKIVATNDSHFISCLDVEAHDALLCINTQKLIAEEKRMRYSGTEYLKSAEEMKQLFRDHLENQVIEEAIANTLEVANKVKAYEGILGDPRIPDYPIPPDHNADTYLEKLAWEGLFERRGCKHKSEISATDKERMEIELKVLQDKGFSTYFLVVWDYIKYARDNNIPVGPGRGSAAGSLVAYSLRITNIDPVHHGLLFERFLNPERKSMPDIDTDFCIENRDVMIKYVTKRYGEERVAQIITFNRMTSKAVLKDVGRVLGVSFGEANKMAKLIPVARGKPAKLKVMISNETPSPEFKEAYDNQEILIENNQGEKASTISVRQWIDMAIRIEGTNKAFGVHAAGVVISKEPLDEIVPLQRNNDGSVITQYHMEDIESLGLLKMDFLGLKNLTIIQKTVNLIKKNRLINLIPDDLPAEERKIMKILAKGEIKGKQKEVDQTYKLIKSGDLEGVFQLESSGMVDVVKKLKPTSIEDISSILALYRPGPLDAGLIPKFIDRKHGREEIKYQHPKLEPILKETYGVLCLPKGTLIDKQDGSREVIENVKSGEVILTSDGKKVWKAKVAKQWRSGVREILKITLSSGTVIYSGKNHRFLTPEGDKFAWELQPRIEGVNGLMYGSEVYEKWQVSSNKKQLRKNEAYLLGLLIGNSYFVSSPLNISCLTEKGTAWVENLIDEIWGEEVKYSFDALFTALTEFLDSIYGSRSWQVKSATKHLPEDILDYLEKDRIDLLLGLWNSCGYTQEKFLYYRSSSPRLLSQVGKLLGSLKIDYYLADNYVEVSERSWFIYLLRNSQMPNQQKEEIRESYLPISSLTLATGLENSIFQADSSSRDIMESSLPKAMLFKQTNFSDISQLENRKKVRENHLQISSLTLAAGLNNSIFQTDSSSREIMESSLPKAMLFKQTNFSDISQLKNREKIRENHLQISSLTLAAGLENSIFQTDSSSRKTLESFLGKASLFKQTNFSDISQLENREKIRENHLQIFPFTLATGLENSIFQTDSSSRKTLESFLGKASLFKQTNFSDISQLENREKVRENHLQIFPFTLATGLENSIFQTDSSSRKTLESFLGKASLFKQTNFSDISQLENREKVREKHLQISSLTLAAGLENSIFQTDSSSRKTFFQTDSSSRKIIESFLAKASLFKQINFSDRPQLENWKESDREIYEKTYLQDARLVYVISVEEAGEAECFDLEMEDQSSPYFLAEGVVVHNCYQEQIMKMAQDLAGYSLGEADLLRRCLSGSTKVIDAATGNLVSLKEIAAKPEYWLSRKVFSLDIKSQQIVQQPITEIYSNGVRDVWEITTRTNRKIRATHDHLFYTALGWKPLKDFSVGDRLGLPNKIPINHSSQISDAQIKLTAYLIGNRDLSTSSQYCSYFCNSDAELIADFNRCIEELFGFSFLIGQKPSQGKKLVIYVRIDFILAFNNWVDNYLKYPNLQNQEIPNWVFSMSKSQLQLFLGILWSINSSFDKTIGQIDYTSTSEFLVKPIQHLLLRLGIVSFFDIKKIKDIGQPFISYMVKITGREDVLKFCKLIQPYLSSYKQQLSQSCYLVIKDKEKNQSKHCLTPEILTLIANTQKASVMTMVEIDKTVGICRGTMSSGLNFQNTPTQSLSPHKINNLATAFADGELISINNSEVFWDEITSIEYIGKEEVFDLTIPETHNFIANDFIVHNCMGKKKVSEMEKHREIFIDGATQRGVPSTVAKDLFEQMIKFAEYCFNKSHSTAYAYVAYQTAYLKANYPVEYMAALLTANSGDQDKVQKYIANCQKSNIEVEPPNINQSEVDFTPLRIVATGEIRNKILFGLSAVKNVGEGAIEAILNARTKSGEFKSLADLCDRVNLNALNSRTLESLIKCGAFDKIEPNRHQLIKNLEGVMKWAQDRNKDRNMGQLSLFDIAETTMPAFDSSPKYSNVSDFSAKEKLQYEKEILGFYVSDHPLKYAQEQNQIQDAISIAQMKDKKSNSKIKLVVMLAGIKPHVTKKGDPMAFLQVEDMTGQVDAVVFPKVYEKIKDLLTENSLLVLNGKVDKKDDESQLLIDSAEALEKVMVDAVEKQEKSVTELYNYQNESINEEIKINQSTTKVEKLVEQLESQKNLWKKVTELLITKNGSAKQRQIIILQLSVDQIPEDNSLFEQIQAILKEQSSGDQEKAKVAIGTLIFDDKQEKLVQFGREFWVEDGEATINRFKAKELEVKLLLTDIM